VIILAPSRRANFAVCSPMFGWGRLAEGLKRSPVASAGLVQHKSFVCRIIHPFKIECSR
jgi:hypothetical protein